MPASVAPGAGPPPGRPVAAISPPASAATLMARPGPQIKQVEQVSAARDQARVHGHVQRAAAQQGTRGQPGRADAADLDGAGGHLAVGQGPQVAAESAPVAAAREVVIAAEGAGPGGGRHQRGPGPAGEAGGERGRERGPGGGGGPFEQGDRLAAVVGPGPGRGPARRAGPAAVRTRPGPPPAARTAPIRLRGRAARSAPPAHRALAEALASGWADRLLACFGLEDCFAVAVAVRGRRGGGGRARAGRARAGQRAVAARFARRHLLVEGLRRHDLADRGVRIVHAAEVVRPPT